MSEFLQKYRGFLCGVMKWDDLTQLWQAIESQSDNQWFLYAIGEWVPESTSSKDQLNRFIAKIDILLREEHDEDYCGIVYVDNVESPSFVKIYDPNNLGVVCGYSDNPPLPGWVMSQVPPEDLQQAFPPPENRRLWWQKLFS